MLATYFIFYYLLVFCMLPIFSSWCVFLVLLVSCGWVFPLHAQNPSEKFVSPANLTVYDSVGADSVITATQARVAAIQDSVASLADQAQQALNRLDAQQSLSRVPTIGQDSLQQLLERLDQKKQALQQRVQRSTQQVRDVLDSLPIPQGVLPSRIPTAWSGFSVENSLPPVAGGEIPQSSSGFPSLPGIPNLPASLSKVSESTIMHQGKGFAEPAQRYTKKFQDTKSGVLDSLNSIKQLAQPYQQYIPPDSLSYQQVRDTLLSEGTRQTEAWAENYAQEQLEGQLPPPAMQAVPQEEAMRQQLTGEATRYFDTNHQLLTQVQEGLTKLKRTYRQVQTGDSIFVKNTSLEGVPMRERFSYGINLNASQLSTASFQLRPQLGYQLNKVWTTGLGGVVQASGQWEPLSAQVELSAGSAFIQRQVKGQLLLYTELQYGTIPTGQENQVSASTTTLDWQGFVGVGKQLALSDKLALQLLFLWDALSSAEIPLQDRVQLRVGILKRSAH